MEAHFSLISNPGRSSSQPSSVHKYREFNRVVFNGTIKSLSADSSVSENEFIRKDGGLQEESEAVWKAIETLESLEGSPDESGSDREAALSSLEILVREFSSQVIMAHFEPLSRVLVNQWTKPQSVIHRAVLRVLTELFQKPYIIVPCISGYFELLTLKILYSHADNAIEVVCAAEDCAAAMAIHFPTDEVIRFLIPLLLMGEFPDNQAAIKMLTRLVEHQEPATIQPHLGDFMPGILKAYDNNESSVRMAAVFCMVALHKSLGGELLAPHLASLSGPKLKLLDLYTGSCCPCLYT